MSLCVLNQPIIDSAADPALIFQEIYLRNRRHATLGLETLAILYSLPYALLMWGYVVDPNLTDICVDFHTS